MLKWIIKWFKLNKIIFICYRIKYFGLEKLYWNNLNIIYKEQIIILLICWNTY